MGFFSNLFRGRDAPSNSTAGSGYGFFMGSTASGKRVNARSAMQMTAVYSCVRILSEAVAGLPLQFYRYNDIQAMEMRKKRRWIIRFIFCCMMSRIRR